MEAEATLYAATNIVSWDMIKETTAEDNTLKQLGQLITGCREDDIKHAEIPQILLPITTPDAKPQEDTNNEPRRRKMPYTVGRENTEPLVQPVETPNHVPEQKEVSHSDPPQTPLQSKPPSLSSQQRIPLALRRLMPHNKAGLKEL
ncbi:hypothetical protein Ahia01_000058000 [Argonauta hians]